MSASTALAVAVPASGLAPGGAISATFMDSQVGAVLALVGGAISGVSVLIAKYKLDEGEGYDDWACYQ